MATAQQAARITDPITHGLGLVGIAGGMLVGAVAGLILIAALPVTAPALLVGLTAAAAVGAVAGGGLAGHQLLAGIQRACALPSPTTGMIGAVGSPNVRIGKLPAARVVSELATSCNGLYALSHLPIPPLPQARIAEGSQTIRINGLFAARVSGKTECGATIQHGALTVYFGGPTTRVLAVVDGEAALLSLLGFVAKASLVAAFLLTIPLGLGAVAMFGVFVGGFIAVNYGLGVIGGHLPPGWKDILQGSFGIIAIVGGAKLGARALERAQFKTLRPSDEVPNARTLAEQRATLIRETVPKSRQPRAVAAAVNRISGRAYYGTSGPPNPTLSEIHPELQSRIPNPSLEPRFPPENCAEFKAVNNALKDGATIRDLDVHTVKVINGEPFERCSNCKVTTSETNVTSDPSDATQTPNEP